MNEASALCVDNLSRLCADDVLLQWYHIQYFFRISALSYPEFRIKQYPIVFSDNCTNRKQFCCGNGLLVLL